MQKKSQVTTSMLVGIIILIAIGLIIFSNQIKLKETGLEQVLDLPFEVQPVNQFIQNCLSLIVEDGIKFVSAQGGYYQVSEPKIDDAFFKVPYYFHLDQDLFPAKDVIEQELNKFISDEFSVCVDNLNVFRDQGYQFDFGELKVVSSLDKTVNVRVDFPVNIKKDTFNGKIERFNHNIEFDFERIYWILLNFALEHKKNPNFVPLAALADSAYSNDFRFEVVDYPEDSIVYNFLFNNTGLKDTYIFSFGAKYDWSDLGIEDKKVEINSIGSQEAFVGEEFSYQVNAKGENIKFSDFSTILDIDSNTGLIKFTPTNEQGGKHFVMVKASNNEGNSDSKIFELNVKDAGREPVIEHIPDFKINVGESFLYTVIAADPDEDEVFYLDDSDLFNINPVTGLIDFTTTGDMKGEHLVKIIAVDVTGLTDTEEFELAIE